MPSNHLILCRPLLLLPSIFSNIRVLSNESALSIRWPKYSTVISKPNRKANLCFSVLCSFLFLFIYLFIATIASLIFWFLLQWTRINEILCFRMAFLLCIINFYFMCLHYFIVLRFFIIS